MITTVAALGLGYFIGGSCLNYAQWKVHVWKVEKDPEIPGGWELGRGAEFSLSTLFTFVATVGLVVTAGLLHLVDFSLSLSSSSLALLAFVAGGTFSIILWGPIGLLPANWLQFWCQPIGFVLILYLLFGHYGHSGYSGGSPSHVQVIRPTSVERTRMVPLSLTTHQVDNRVLYPDDAGECKRIDPLAKNMVTDLYNPVIPIAHFNAMRANNLCKDLGDDRIDYK